MRCRRACAIVALYVTSRPTRAKLATLRLSLAVPERDRKIGQVAPTMYKMGRRIVSGVARTNGAHGPIGLSH